MTIKTTNKYSIITIVNWQTYQTQENENDKQNDKPLTNKGQHTRTKEHKNISPEEIQSLEERYSDKDLINQCFKSISSTRKTNRISDSVKLNILNKWNEYPAEQVKAAMRIYLEKGYAAQGKEENYLLGIIRGNAKQQPAANISSGKVMKRTGSMLDKVYQEQGFTLI
ncbi:MAG: hypothetical protein QUS13_02510 [Smithella sp.]|nr:hypothetical protein [Smithella sp.]